MPRRGHHPGRPSSASSPRPRALPVQPLWALTWGIYRRRRRSGLRTLPRGLPGLRSVVRPVGVLPPGACLPEHARRLQGFQLGPKRKSCLSPARLPESYSLYRLIQVKGHYVPAVQYLDQHLHTTEYS
ncbi:peroxisome biogenesis factor 2 isoform X2 [Anas acuta]|uniref:peroxisome biogenesis factor 2 isoform X2 n=1 Tax=Anas acuta TaxID=28680 RepID=UPI0035C8AB6A